MLQKLWKLIKENLATLVAIGTVLFTCVYAILKFVIYIYWSGYFNNLNIDMGFMHLNYDGFIYQVIFFAFFFLMLWYMMWETDAICTNIFNINWDKSAKKNQKILIFVKVGILNLLFSNLFLQMANFPLIIFICSSNHMEMSFRNIFVLMLLLYLGEILMIAVHKFNAKDSEKTNKKLEDKLGTYIIMGLLIISFILAGSYYYGSQALSQKSQIMLVDNKQYLISYNTGEKYVLHKVDIKDDIAIVYRNEQKIISNENCEFVVKNVDEIKIINQYHIEDAK